MSHRRKPVSRTGASPATELRRRYRLSQQEAADRLGCSIGHLRLLEMQSNRLRPEDVKMIERYFARGATKTPPASYLRAVAAAPCGEGDR